MSESKQIARGRPSPDGPIDLATEAGQRQIHDRVTALIDQSSNNHDAYEQVAAELRLTPSEVWSHFWAENNRRTSAQRDAFFVAVTELLTSDPNLTVQEAVETVHRQTGMKL